MTTALATQKDKPISYSFKIYSSDDENELQYYKQRVEELELSLAHLKPDIENLYQKQEYIKALEDYKEGYLLDCIILNARVELKHCTTMINRKKCNFYNKCNPRLELNKYIQITRK